MSLVKNNSVTTNVRRLLRQNHVKQRELAAGIHMPEQTLSNKLTGKIRFNDAEIFSLSHWLGVPSDALLGLKPLEVA